MNPKIHIIAFCCVLAIAAGQVLFKRLAILFSVSKTIWSLEFIVIGLVAAMIYIGATIGWIWLLQFVQLSRVYPYFALSFVIVPLASAVLFGDTLNLQYSVGVALIVAGVVLIQNISDV
jgi:drug/metabolite transporter (DMT)-like permease